MKKTHWCLTCDLHRTAFFWKPVGSASRFFDYKGLWFDWLGVYLSIGLRRGV